ncbi:hypothetical protein L7F22_064104 [Adiantum nelumboides]|nr:hypothetical protein [Adiantum nelumboides]
MGSLSPSFFSGSDLSGWSLSTSYWFGNTSWSGSSLQSFTPSGALVVVSLSSSHLSDCTSLDMPNNVCHNSEFLKCSKYVQPVSLESKLKGLFHKYTPQQNGVEKHKNRHIVEVARALMSEKNMPPCYWAEAASTAVYTMNMTPTTTVHDMTPEEKFTGKKQNVSHFKVFGCLAYVHVPDELRTKLDPKAKKCVFIGYYVEQKGYICYNPVTRQVRVSRDVIFDEMATWYADVKDDIGADVNKSVVENSNVQSQVLSGPQRSSTSSHVANPWGGRLRRNEAKITLLRKALESKIMNEEDDMNTFLAGVKDINEQLYFCSGMHRVFDGENFDDTVEDLDGATDYLSDRRKEEEVPKVPKWMVNKAEEISNNRVAVSVLGAAMEFFEIALVEFSLGIEIWSSDNGMAVKNCTAKSEVQTEEHWRNGIGKKGQGILVSGCTHFQAIIAPSADVTIERTNFAWRAQLEVNFAWRARLEGSGDIVVVAFDPKEEETQVWLKRIGLYEFACLPWHAWVENEFAEQQWNMIKEGKGLIAGDVHLTLKLVSKIFKIPYLSVPAKGKKVTDSQMKGEFGNPIGAKSYYMVRNAGGIQAANLFWYLEKICILQKTAYMSKEAFAPFYQAEQGVKMDWVTVLNNWMQLIGERDRRRTLAVSRVAPYLAAIFEHVLKVTPAASGKKTMAADTLMEEGIVSGSKRRKLLLGSPTIDVKSPFKVSWKDLEEPDSKMSFFFMGSELKKSESKGKKITFFLMGIVGSAGKNVPKSSLAKEGSKASHGSMGIFSVEEATNYLTDLGKFLQSQDEALRVLENAKQEHKCSVASKREMQNISMQLLQAKSDKEKLQEEVARLQAKVDEQFKEFDEKMAAVTTENVFLINRLSPLAEMEKERVKRENEALKIDNERLIAEMEEMQNNRKEIEDSLSKMKAEFCGGFLEPDWNLVVERNRM